MRLPSGGGGGRRAHRRLARRPARAVPRGGRALRAAASPRCSASSPVSTSPPRAASTVDGVEITRLGEDELARFRRDTIGYVFQSYHLIPTLTALENVAVPLWLGRRGDALGRAHALLGEVGLADRAPPLPRPALGRRAAARRRRARRRPPAAAAPGRRAHRQPRLGHRQADHRAPRRAQPEARQHARARDPRRRPGRRTPTASSPCATAAS